MGLSEKISVQMRSQTIYLFIKIMTVIHFILRLACSDAKFPEIMLTEFLKVFQQEARFLQALVSVLGQFNLDNAAHQALFRTFRSIIIKIHEIGSEFELTREHSLAIMPAIMMLMTSHKISFEEKESLVPLISIHLPKASPLVNGSVEGIKKKLQEHGRENQFMLVLLGVLRGQRDRWLSTNLQCGNWIDAFLPIMIHKAYQKCQLIFRGKKCSQIIRNHKGEQLEFKSVTESLELFLNTFRQILGDCPYSYHMRLWEQERFIEYCLNSRKLYEIFLWIIEWKIEEMDNDYKYLSLLDLKEKKTQNSPVRIQEPLLRKQMINWLKSLCFDSIALILRHINPYIDIQNSEYLLVKHLDILCEEVINCCLSVSVRIRRFQANNHHLEQIINSFFRFLKDCLRFKKLLKIYVLANRNDFLTFVLPFLRVREQEKNLLKNPQTFCFFVERIQEKQKMESYPVYTFIWQCQEQLSFYSIGLLSVCIIALKIDLIRRVAAKNRCKFEQNAQYQFLMNQTSPPPGATIQACLLGMLSVQKQINSRPKLQEKLTSLIEYLNIQKLGLLNVWQKSLLFYIVSQNIGIIFKAVGRVKIQKLLLSAFQTIYDNKTLHYTAVRLIINFCQDCLLQVRYEDKKFVDYCCVVEQVVWPQLIKKAKRSTKLSSWEIVQQMIDFLSQKPEGVEHSAKWDTISRKFQPFLFELSKVTVSKTLQTLKQARRFRRNEDIEEISSESESPKSKAASRRPSNQLRWF